MKILMKGKVETVSVDCVKPAHFKCEPETGTTTNRKVQSKTTYSTTTGIVCGTRKDQIRSSSTLTRKSDRKRVKLTKNTQTQSAATKIGASLATTPQHQAHRVNLPRQLTPYVAPQSRTPVVSRANGSDGGLRTYSRVPLHLWGKTNTNPNTNDTPKIPDVRNNSNTADSDKIISDTTVKQTRIGRKTILPHDSCRWSTP